MDWNHLKKAAAHYLIGIPIKIAVDPSPSSDSFKDMVFRFFLFFLMFSLLSCGTKQKRESAQKRAGLHMQIADALLANGKNPEALSELSMAEQLDPKNPVIQNKLGIVYQLRGKPKEAERRFRKALALNPNYTDVRANLARLYLDQKQYSQALIEINYVEADLTYPAPEKALTLRGMVYFHQGKFSQAESLLEKSYQAQRTNCLSSYFLGRVYLSEKKLKEASQILDQSIKNCESSQFEEPLFYSAMAYYEQGEKLQAKARAEELLLKYKKSPMAKKAEGLLNILEDL